MLPPLHALPELRRPLPHIRLPENIQMLMPDEVKIILLPEPLFPRAFHLPLELDDILAQDEPGFKKAHQHPRRDWHEMLAAPRITHEDGAVLPGRKDAHALLCDPAHFSGELGDAVHARQVALAVVRVRDDACIGRMGGDEVDGLALNQVKRPRIPHVSFDFRRLIVSIQRRISKIQPVARHHDSIGIDVHTHGAPSQELAFHKHSAASSHLVKHQIPRRRIAQNEITRDIWRPVAPVIPDVRCPVAAVGEAPDRGGFGCEGGGGEF